MGYSFHLGKVTKKKREAFKNLSVAAIKKKNKEEYFRPYDIATKLFELGKEFELRTIKPHLQKFFTNPTTHKKLASGDPFFFILTKDGLKALIEDMAEDIKKHFLDQEQQVIKLSEGKLSEYDKSRLLRNIGSKRDEWSNKYGLTPYKLTGPHLVNSCKFEYAIFELVNLYRTFNFKTNYLILYAH